MTISTTQDSVVIGGNGSTTSFSFPFVGVATSDISVVYTDASGNQTTLSSSQYSVTFNPLASGQIWQVGGTVTYPLSGSPIAVGTTLTISRTLPLTQTASISNQGDFYPQVVEQALDTLCMEIQQVSAAVSLAVRAPASDGSLNLLPPAAKRANQALLFDANGQPVVGAPGGTGVPISTAMQPVVAASSTSAALTLLGGAPTNAIPYKNAVSDFGAVGDDSTNNDAAATAAVAWINAHGGYVFWPAGKYRFNSSMPAITSAGGGFIGAGSGYNSIAGTMFRHNATTGDLITITGVDQCLIQGITFYPVLHKTSGSEINIGGISQGVVLEKLYFLYTYRPVTIGSSAWTTLRDILSLFIFSDAHIWIEGAAGTNNEVQGVTMYNVITGSGPETGPAHAKGNWGASTGYAVDDFVIANGYIWQCVTAGTSASTGTGPAPAGYTNAADPWSVKINDGTAQWLLACSQNAAGCWVDSYSYLIWMHACQYNAGVFGLLLNDGVGLSNSWPFYVFTVNLYCDHNYSYGIALNGGEFAFFDDANSTGSLTACGLHVASTFKGGVNVRGGLYAGNAQEGIKIESGPQYVDIDNAEVVGNSVQTSGSFAGISAVSGATYFKLTNNRCGPALYYSTPHSYGISIGASCNHFNVSGNALDANTTGAYLNSAGVSATKVFCNNTPDADGNVAVTRSMQPATFSASTVSTAVAGNDAGTEVATYVQAGTTGAIAGTSSSAITFPTAFPNALISVTVTPSGATSGAQAANYTDGWSTTGFTLHNQGSASTTFAWVAVGR